MSAAKIIPIPTSKAKKKQRRPRSMVKGKSTYLEIDDKRSKIWMQAFPGSKWKKLSPRKAKELGSWLLRASRYLRQRED